MPLSAPVPCSPFPGARTSTLSSTFWRAGAGAGEERRPLHSGQLAVFGPGEAISVAADEKQESRSPALDVVVLGGLPIRQRVAWNGPFVMNTRSEFLQAFDAFQAGRFGLIPAA
ncbi:hypothetical protein SSP24_78520 [Streptomyces spinoverrucosus]|uniref:Pirin C-terminal domain-containing protein n=1 Tax=Streptomyces spinoverrucosus TaxID=284043 RepID=A0A4Y3VTN8_9ACTN|nr:hypothetical protein SSP24_78520 [Streptomyces spinoverrucosus]